MLKRLKTNKSNIFKKLRSLREYRKIIIEEFISGREIQASIIGSKKLGAIELKPTGFPQLTADDVIKYKYLMTYGTPREFSDGFHHYDNSKTVLKVRELDKSHVQILMNSPEVSEQLDIAIEDMYSVEGIEYQKRLLLRSIDP